MESPVGGCSPGEPPLVAVVIPCWQAEAWLDDCLGSVLREWQGKDATAVDGGDFRDGDVGIRMDDASPTTTTPAYPEDPEGALAARFPLPPTRVIVSAYDDRSTDGTWDALLAWKPRLEAIGLRVVLGRNPVDGPVEAHGCGFAKNACIRQCNAPYLCFLDVDDINITGRIQRQYAAYRDLEERFPDDTFILGGTFVREPPGSTQRYTDWHNALLTEDDMLAARFKEIPVAHPTWFLGRSVWRERGGYFENPPLAPGDAAPIPQPEDILFLWRHVDAGGRLHKLRGPPVVVYRWHTSSLSHHIHRNLLLRHKAAALEASLLQQPQWARFQIWGNGRDGKRFFRFLQPETQRRVTAFLEVDPKKVGREYYLRDLDVRVPIIHWRQCQAPFFLAVNMNRDNGMEENLAELGMEAGVHFYPIV